MKSISPHPGTRERKKQRTVPCLISAATRNRKDSGSLKTAEFARKQGVKVLRYQGEKKNEGDLLTYAKTLADPEAFRSFLKRSLSLRNFHSTRKYSRE